jgi:hypothetical protein
VFPVDGAQAGQQRPTRTSGVIAAEATLKVSWPWDDPLELGTEVEILRLIPAVRELGRAGWNEIVNDVLRDIPTIRRHPVTAVDGQVQYAVPAYLETEDQAIGIYDPGSPATQAQVLSQNLQSISYDGEHVNIALWGGYAAGSEFYLAVYQPTSTRVNQGGVWADTPDGLVSDDDEALAPRRLVQAMAIERAAHLELTRPDARSRPMWQAAQERWAPLAAGLKRRLVPSRPDQRLTLGTTGTPTWPKGLYR